MGLINFDISFKQTVCRGETICGDAVSIVEETENGITHIAVVDGLGHGPNANKAALAFVEFFQSALHIPIPQMLHNASVAISKTRGVAASVLRLDANRKTVQFAGVGNVELTAIGAVPIRPISKAGIVGRRIGRIVQFEYPLHTGDLLTIFTDGISSRFNLEPLRKLDTQSLCNQILSEWGKNHDDATVLAIRCA